MSLYAPNRFKPRLSEDDMVTGICDNCGEPCTSTLRDLGIGPYEYWGERGVHRDWQVVSPCCDAEVVPGGCTLKRKVIRTATRDLKCGIKKGQKYEEKVFHHWRENGPGWYTTEKRVIG